MSHFSFVAQDKYRTLVRGDIEAKNRTEAFEALTGRGLSPIQIELIALEENGLKAKISKIFSVPAIFGGKLTLFDQMTFVRNLGTLLNTGMDIITCLETIREDAIKPLVKRIANNLKSRITKGESLSAAFQAWHDDFNPVFVHLVRAGEASGTLPDVLVNYAQELRKEYTFRRKLRGSMIYPSVLIAALIGMIILILTVVIPRLKELFRSTKIEPPLYTKIFFTVSDIWLAAMPIIIGAAVLLTVVIIVMLQNKKLRRVLGLALWYIPLIKKIQKNLILMRFSKTIAALLNAGFALKSALSIASEGLIPNYRQALTEIAETKIERGISFSQGLSYYPKLFPHTYVSVVATGEKSGQLNRVLLQMAEFYEEDVAYALETFLTLVEPLLLIFVGLVVGLIASSLISPLYNLIGKIH